MIITVTMNPAIDQTIEVDHFAEGDTNRVESIRWDIGGKGINVARVLKELGYEPLAMGFAPGDLGRMIEERLRDEYIGADFTFIPGETRTNVNILDRAQHRHTVLSAPGPSASEEDLEELFASIRRRLRPDTWLVLAGSLPPPCTGGYYARLIREAERAGALTALDAEGSIVRRVLDEGARPTLIKINAHELHRVDDAPVETEEQVRCAAEAVRLRGVPAVVVTRGPAGAIALTPEGDFRVMVPEVETLSAVGAGDAFLAALLLGMRHGDDWRTALREAAAAGAACCLTAGNAECRSEDVHRLTPQVRVDRLPFSSLAQPSLA